MSITRNYFEYDPNDLYIPYNDEVSFENKLDQDLENVVSNPLLKFSDDLKKIREENPTLSENIQSAAIKGGEKLVQEVANARFSNPIIQGTIGGVAALVSDEVTGYQTEDSQREEVSKKIQEQINSNQVLVSAIDLNKANVEATKKYCDELCEGFIEVLTQKSPVEQRTMMGYLAEGMYSLASVFGFSQQPEVKEKKLEDTINQKIQEVSNRCKQGLESQEKNFENKIKEGIENNRFSFQAGDNEEDKLLRQLKGAASTISASVLEAGAYSLAARLTVLAGTPAIVSLAAPVLLSALVSSAMVTITHNRERILKMVDGDIVTDTNREFIEQFNKSTVGGTVAAMLGNRGMGIRIGAAILAGILSENVYSSKMSKEEMELLVSASTGFLHADIQAESVRYQKDQFEECLQMMKEAFNNVINNTDTDDVTKEKLSRLLKEKIEQHRKEFDLRIKDYEDNLQIFDKVETLEDEKKLLQKTLATMAGELMVFYLIQKLRNPTSTEMRNGESNSQPEVSMAQDVKTESEAQEVKTAKVDSLDVFELQNRIKAQMDFFKLESFKLSLKHIAMSSSLEVNGKISTTGLLKIYQSNLDKLAKIKSLTEEFKEITNSEQFELINGLAIKEAQAIEREQKLIVNKMTKKCGVDLKRVGLHGTGYAFLNKPDSLDGESAEFLRKLNISIELLKDYKQTCRTIKKLEKISEKYRNQTGEELSSGQKQMIENMQKSLLVKKGLREAALKDEIEFASSQFVNEALEILKVVEPEGFSDWLKLLDDLTKMNSLVNEYLGENSSNNIVSLRDTLSEDNFELIRSKLEAKLKDLIERLPPVETYSLPLIRKSYEAYSIKYNEGRGLVEKFKNNPLFENYAFVEKLIANETTKLYSTIKMIADYAEKYEDRTTFKYQKHQTYREEDIRTNEEIARRDQQMGRLPEAPQYSQQTNEIVEKMNKRQMEEKLNENRKQVEMEKLETIRKPKIPYRKFPGRR